MQHSSRLATRIADIADIVHLIRQRNVLVARGQKFEASSYLLRG